jgi:hypothetical protein
MGSGQSQAGSVLVCAFTSAARTLAARLGALAFAVTFTGHAPHANADGMHTGHQFSVTEAGAANLSIPIQVPRGIAGMEPQLSLVYSSASGNGPLGLGWSLAGPSTISRCGKTLQNDGVRGVVTHTAADRFCLDGQRLVTSTPSTDATYHPTSTVTREYVSERDSFSKIVATGNATSQSTGAPNSFRVYTKSGLILDYGLSANSRGSTKFVGSMAAQQVVQHWHLQRISDRMSTPSYVEYYYCAGRINATGSACDTSIYDGFLRLHYIRYTNRGATPNGSLAVVLSYETRPDQRIGYSSGSVAVQNQRIAHISTYIGFTGLTSLGTRIKVYEMTYEPPTVGATTVRLTNISRLSQVQELRGGVASIARPPPARTSAADALPPMVFTYPEDSLHGMVSPTSSAPAPTIPRGCGGAAGTRLSQFCE